MEISKKIFWRNWPKVPRVAWGHWTLIFLANLNPYKGHSIKFTCPFLPEICFLALSNLRLLQRIEQFCWFQPNWFKITHLKKRFWDIFNKKSTGFYQYMFKTIINFRINKEKPNLDTSFYYIWLRIDNMKVLPFNFLNYSAYFSLKNARME